MHVIIIIIEGLWLYMYTIKIQLHIWLYMYTIKIQQHILLIYQYIIVSVPSCSHTNNSIQQTGGGNGYEV